MILDQIYLEEMRRRGELDECGNWAHSISDLTVDGVAWPAAFARQYLAVLELHSQCRHRAALDHALGLLEASRESTVGLAARVVAERMWDLDLRSTYPQAVEHLRRAVERPISEAENVLALTMLGDFHLCRGRTEAGARTLDRARSALAEPNLLHRQELQGSHDLAYARQLQGERRLDEALAVLTDSLNAGSRHWWLSAQMLLRLTRTHLMRQDTTSARQALATYQQLDNAASSRPIPHAWDEIELEYLFVKGEVELVARNLDSAHDALRQAIDAAREQTSIEVETEAWVHLARVGALASWTNLVEEALINARALVARAEAGAYSDLILDIDRIERVIRFRKPPSKATVSNGNPSVLSGCSVEKFCDPGILVPWGCWAG